ncbi:MAG: hypothetical protein HC780_05065 [Leptolyngbyaceae cyanobacterium CSU_1_3]|nr:hypothetical protein [Leptolyngbyaceae cyanobacterium CSU_1_3]
MTLKQAESEIASRYSRLVRKVLVDVSLTTPRPLNVAVAGEIGRPGSYTLTLTEGGKFPTITRIIQQAGGMTQSANPRQVTLTRQQRSGPDQVININLWELFQTGNLKQDITLRDGDSILVAPKTEFDLAESSQLAAANFSADTSQPLNIAVVGQVNRPGPYVLSSRGQSGQSGQDAPAKTGGGLPTITQAIQQAGGITQLADIRKIEVRRATRSGKFQAIQIDLWQLLNKGDLSQDLVLQQGDTVSIPIATAINTAEASQLGLASFAPGSVRINVVGEVVRPGGVEVQPNTPLNQAILAAGGFNKDAKKSTVELIRLNPNGTVVRQTIDVDLAKGIDDKTNPIVRSNDIIVVNRSGAAKFSDTLDRVLGPFGKILPFRFLLGI